MVYAREIDGRRYDFGVSGLLYRRNLLFFDRQTDSLWSQLLSQAVTGPMAGTRLEFVPAENTTWGAWKKARPDTRVLSFTTGHVRDYRRDPYAHRKAPRNPALLVSAGGLAKIYPFSELQKVSSSVIDRLREHEVTVRFDSGSQTAKAECEQSACAAYFVSYLDDLKAFFPEAKIFAGPR